VIFVAFKAIDPVLRGQDGGFDSHTLPPYLSDATHVIEKRGGKRRRYRIFIRFCVQVSAARVTTVFITYYGNCWTQGGPFTHRICDPEPPAHSSPKGEEQLFLPLEIRLRLACVFCILKGGASGFLKHLCEPPDSPFQANFLMQLIKVCVKN